MRIAIGRLYTESASISPLLADEALFRAGALVEGPELLEFFSGRITEIRGFLDVLEPRGVDVVPLVGAQASCSGPFVDAFWSDLLERFVTRLREALPVDGVLLSLHGAVMAESEEDVTGALLAAIRAVVGPDVPVVATLDLHANVTRQMVGAATALVAYKTYPHHDYIDRGRQAAQLLLDTLDERVKPSMISLSLPMRLGALSLLEELIAHGSELERASDVLCCSVFQTHSATDARDYMPCRAVVVTNNDPRLARNLARELLAHAWRERERSIGEDVQLTPLPGAVHAALALPPGTVVIADRFDAVTAGFPGDSVELARNVVQLNVREPVCVILTDPAFARRAAKAGIGGTVTGPLGGSWGGELYQPLEVTARVRALTDGTILPSHEPLPGHLSVTSTSMGLTAVVQIEPCITAVVTSIPVMSTEPTVYRSAGVEPYDYRIVLTKSMAQQRLHYREAAGFIDLDGPGWAQLIKTSPWRNRPRTDVYPEVQLTDADIAAWLTGN